VALGPDGAKGLQAFTVDLPWPPSGSVGAGFGHYLGPLSFGLDFGSSAGGENFTNNGSTVDQCMNCTVPPQTYPAGRRRLDPHE